MATINAIKTDLSFANLLKKSYLVGILTATTLGIVPLSAGANPNPCCQARGGDSAVVQTSNQQATVKGSGNGVNQHSNQSAISGRPTGGDQGIVQDQSQGANNSGYGNYINQTSNQSSRGQNRRPIIQRPVNRSNACNNTCAKNGI
ncbi:hypothetical protein [Aerosakkonema funiforme]|uniref:Uncharacterized protein n=1 Tax=Aerosakkonema funiforme FACHB-1375 TaxID=2949571 RepID=A0A926VGL4_9CYAN|nr:hypothetical protein [Aerosakkonema funiforme]MBD2182279.1 hypothetical protein [Aerosakkonema funiforme FACHB-1375]